MLTKETTLAWKPNARPLMALALLVLSIMALVSIGSNSSATASATAQPASKIESKVLVQTLDGKSTSFVVLMTEKANLTPAYGMKDQDARGWFVYNTLRETANRSQAGIRATLDAKGVQYKTLWIANALVVTGDRALVNELAARPDVRAIEHNAIMYLMEPVRAEADTSNATSAPLAPSGAITIEWGVENVRAPEVWDLGYTGQGIVVAGADTGIRWTHQALKSQYRGWDGLVANHDYNWHDAIHIPDPSDPCGPDTEEPCDGHDHGTHTVGTAVGDDGMGQKIGVAPGAEWIGCRNMMAAGVGFGAVFDTYAECFEWFLAPTKIDGTMPDPTKRPHVIINSWGCPEGCTPETLREIVEATVASGIFVEASAGNDGPACSTVTVPPAIFEASFTVGAIDINNTLAEFSSRGPVVTDGSMRTKPDISAPGVDTRSAISSSDTAYDDFSGTSMAGPHVAGVVALVWSARPELVRQITETRTLLEQTANPHVAVIDPIQQCGGTTEANIPNNFFGHGRIDAFAAIERASVGGPLPSATPVASPTACPIQFADVPSSGEGSTFYTWVRCLACRQIVGGYPCGEPGETCNENNEPYYRPGANVTRGQLSKIVALSAGLNDPIAEGQQQFADVEPEDPFYMYVERLAQTGAIAGYPCATAGEGCDELNRPFFRPNNPATRGQIAKIVAISAAYGEDIPATQETFTDVPTDSPFWVYIERLAGRGVISGYGDASKCPETGAPCFRYNDLTTRGQMAKIAANAFFPNCQTPARR
ncbi:MAG: S8 family serine peptidase [Chloroflexota bacterium]|nr:S8 family serine peptidase [Chloroflexota bacterium]